MADLAGLIAKQGSDLRLRQAIVTAAPSGGTCTIRFGDLASTTVADDIAGVHYLAGASFSNGDTVWVLQTGGALLIVGRVAGAADAWIPWIPTFTNLTVGNGTLVAKYIRLGMTIHYRVRFVLGSTSAMGTNPVFTLPVAAAADYVIEWPLGPAVMIDNGVKGYSGYTQINSLTQALIRNDDGLGSFSPTTATAPFTWGPGDYFMLTGTYEAASS